MNTTHGTSLRLSKGGYRGATTVEKLRGTNVWVPTPGRLRPAPGQGRAGCWVREGVAPSCCEDPGVSPLENVWKIRSCILVTRLLAVKFLAFWKLGPRSWVDHYIVGPQPKSRGLKVSPVPTVVAPMKWVNYFGNSGYSHSELRRRWLVSIPQLTYFCPVPIGSTLHSVQLKINVGPHNTLLHNRSVVGLFFIYY